MRRLRNALTVILALVVLTPAPQLQASIMSLQTGLLFAYNFQLFGMTEYRTGVKFTEADATILEKVMNDFGEKPVFIQSRSSSDVA